MFGWFLIFSNVILFLFPQIEEAMGTWFNQIILRPNITIDGNMLRKQATIFSEL